MNVELQESLTQFERWAESDADGLARLISTGEGVHPLWQLVVAAFYDDESSYWDRLERAATHFAMTCAGALAAERFLNKALSICDTTGEEDLLAGARRLALAMVPPSATGN